MSVPLQSSPRLCVAICGAGIGGLVLAITIKKYDPAVSVELYEAHDSIDTPGVGISVWRQTHAVMLDLGLLDDFKQIFTHRPESTPGAKFKRSDIREGGYYWFQLAQRHGRSGMHRQQMVAILERHLPASCKVHFKKRLVNYVEPERGPIRLEFEDGTSTTTDVLVGADGIRSAVRKAMFESASKEDGDTLTQYIDPIFTGISVYRGLVPAELLRRENSDHLSFQGLAAYVGKARSLVTYPVANGNLINFVAYICDPSQTGTHYEGRWVSDATREELVEYFDDYERDVKSLVKLCEKPSKWALHVVKPLPFCVRNRVALIGDACHATTPHFGAGAVQAIDDAYILGRLITHPLTSPSRVPDALRIYEQVRFPLARSVANLSLSTGWMYVFMSPGFYDGARNEDDLDEDGMGSYEREGMQIMKQEIYQRWDALDELCDALQTWEDAESKLQALVLK